MPHKLGTYSFRKLSSQTLYYVNMPNLYIKVTLGDVLVHTLMKIRLVRPSQYVIAIFKINNKILLS